MQKDKQALFENAPVGEALLKLAFPTMIGQIVIVIYNIADTYFIGMTNDNIKITAVTICMPIFMILSAIANLYGIGASSVISRALGKLNIKRAQDTSAFAIFCCTGSVLLYSLIIFLFLDPIVDFIGGSGNSDVHNLAREYILVTVISGGFFTALGSMLSHLYRSEGKSLESSIGVVGGGILNIILDPLFMFVILPEGREVFGAALATAISNAATFLYYFVLFLFRDKKKSVLSLSLTKDSFKNKIPSQTFGAGIPACVMTLAENISYAILDNLMVAAGLAAQTGIGVAKKVNMLAHSAVRGIAQGALPLIGYSYSSGNRKKVKKIIMTTVSLSTGVGLFCLAINFCFAKFFVGLFVESTNEALVYGARFLRILCIGGPFSACAYTFISFFQAVGHGKKSLVLALLRKGILDIPLMLVLNAIIRNPNAIVSATPIADTVCCIVSVMLFGTFAAKHLSKNKVRRIYNPESGQLEPVTEQK